MESLKDKAARFRTNEGSVVRAGLGHPGPAVAPASPAVHVNVGNTSRFSGINRTQPTSRRPAPSAPVPGRPADISAQWNDPNRPEGSGYTEEEWLQAEDGGRAIVFEMVKPDERGLMAVDPKRVGMLAELLSRSLLIPSTHVLAAGLPCDARILHRDEDFNPDGPIRFHVVRCERARLASPYLSGSTMLTEQEVAYQAREKQRKQEGSGNRFNEVQRPRQRG